MRSAYVKPSAELAYFVVEWEQSHLSWENFRGSVLGATDPAVASEGSMRNHIL